MSRRKQKEAMINKTINGIIITLILDENPHKDFSFHCCKKSNRQLSDVETMLKINIFKIKGVIDVH